MKQTSSNNKKPHRLSAETIAAMEELGLALKVIYLRLKAEGFRLVDGQLIKPKGYDKQKEDK